MDVKIVQPLIISRKTFSGLFTGRWRIGKKSVYNARSTNQTVIIASKICHTSKHQLVEEY